MAKSATGDAASASIATVRSSGPGSCQRAADSSTPSRIDHGIGLTRMPRSALRAACAAPPPAAPAPTPSSRDSPMHSDEVTTMSNAIAMIIGPAACAPRIATSSGTPMKPVFGNAATNAPKAPSFQPTRALRVNITTPATTTSAPRPQTSATLPSSNCPMGVPAPKRSSMQGSAKYSTKALRPGIASSGRIRARAAP